MSKKGIGLNTTALLAIRSVFQMVTTGNKNYTDSYQD